MELRELAQMSTPYCKSLCFGNKSIANCYTEQFAVAPMLPTPPLGHENDSGCKDDNSSLKGLAPFSMSSGRALAIQTAFDKPGADYERRR